MAIREMYHTQFKYSTVPTRKVLYMEDGQTVTPGDHTVSGKVVCIHVVSHPTESGWMPLDPIVVVPPKTLFRDDVDLGFRTYERDGFFGYAMYESFPEFVKGYASQIAGNLDALEDKEDALAVLKQVRQFKLDSISEGEIIVDLVKDTIDRIEARTLENRQKRISELEEEIKKLR